MTSETNNLCDDYDFDEEAYPAVASFLSEVREDIMRHVSLGKNQSDLYVPFTERIMRNMGGFGTDPSQTFDEMCRHGMVAHVVSIDMMNNMVHATSTEDDVFVSRTALVKCGTFVDVCKYERVTRQHTMVALVLDYDVQMVNGRRLKKNLLRRAPRSVVKIKMFREVTAERCLASTAFAKLSLEALRIATHDIHTVSVMYDSRNHPVELRVQDLLGKNPNHRGTMEALEEMPGDLNTWSFPMMLTPEEEEMIKFLDDNLRFQEFDHLYVAKWVVNALLHVEKGNYVSAVMTVTMFEDLWSCTSNSNIQSITHALRILTVSSRKERASRIFSLRFTKDEVFINPLTYNPRGKERERCWVCPMKAFLDNMRVFFARRPGDGLGLENNNVRCFEAFMMHGLLSPNKRVKDKMSTLRALLYPHELAPANEPERAVAIKKSRCAVCLDTLNTAGPHRPCALPCGHIFGHSCACQLTQCALCKAYVGHPDNLRTLFLNCFEFTEEEANVADDNMNE